MASDKKAEKKSSKKKAWSGQEETVEFVLEKETKGAIRFKEQDGEGNDLESMDDGAIGTLYMRKAFLDRIGYPGVPEGCTITISFNQ